jgi:hypothetical protein
LIIAAQAQDKSSYLARPQTLQLFETPKPETLSKLRVLDYQLQRFRKAERRQTQVNA